MGAAASPPGMPNRPFGPLRLPRLLLQIAQLPLAGGVSLMFFLPESVTQNLTLIEDSLTTEFVRDIDKQLKTVQAALRLPRLRLVAETRLGEALQAMRRCWVGVLGPRDRADAPVAEASSVGLARGRPFHRARGGPKRLLARTGATAMGESHLSGGGGEQRLPPCEASGEGEEEEEEAAGW